jgi:hypothetical protein
MPDTASVTERRARRAAMFLTMWLGVCVSAFGQLTSTWFDINPNNSNGDRNSSSGGRINHVGAASDFSKVYAASEWGGLYQSFDQGNTWVRINTFIPSATWDVKVDPRNSQKVYATSFFDGRVNPQSGISVSKDAGTTWTAVNFAKLNTLNCSIAQRKTQPSAWQIAIDPTNTATVFVGTSCGLARSLDAGVSWTFIDPSPVDAAEQIYAVIAQGSGVVDVIGDNGHLRSTSNGATWTPIGGAPLGPLPGNSGDLASIVASPRENYVLLAETGGTNIFESDDGGATWPTSLTLPLLGSATNVQGRIPFLKTNQLSSSSQFDVWYGDINLFKATAVTPSTLAPGGAPRAPVNSWSSVQDNAHDDTGDVLFDPRFTAGACPSVYSGDGGIYRNTNPNNPGCQGPSWTQPNITPHATWLWGFDGVRVSQGQHALTYGLQDDGGWAATNVAEGQNPPGPNWNNYTCCDLMHNTEGAGKIVAIEGCSGGTCAPAGFPLILRNQDGSSGGELSTYPSGQRLFTPFNNGRENTPFGGTGYVVNVCGSSSCVGGDVYFTNNIGSPSWTSLKSPTSATSGTGNVKVANLQGQPNVLFHTGNGDPESQGLVFRSTMVGATPGSNWVPLPLPGNIGTVTAYDVDPTDANHVIISGIDNATGNFQIFITPDFGTNWTRLQNLENLMLGISPTGGGAVFVNQANQGRATGFLNFNTYWQPSLFKFDPLDSTTIVAGAIDSGVFVSIDNGSTWQTVSNNISPTSATPGIPAPIFAYFSPGRFNASTNAFDVWVGTRGAGVHKVVLERPAPGN